MSLKAMIFAAGYGTRMGPLSDLMAKPAIPFYGRPLIAHTLDWLAASGITTSVVNLHHKPETVRHAVEQHKPSGMDVVFSTENEILGTGGGLKAAERHFQDSDAFLAVNGDIFTQINLEIPIRIHRDQSPLATLVLTDNPDHEALFGVGINVDKEITDFWGEPENSSSLRHCAFTGIHIINPQLIQSLPKSGYACIKEEGYLPALHAGKRLMSAVMGGHWFDLGTPERYLNAHIKMLDHAGALCGYPERKPGIFSADPIPPNVELVKPVVLGPGFIAKERSRIGPCAFIGSNVTIQNKADVEQAIVWDDAHVTQDSKQVIVADQGITVPVKSD